MQDTPARSVYLLAQAVLSLELRQLGLRPLAGLEESGVPLNTIWRIESGYSKGAPLNYPKAGHRATR